MRQDDITRWPLLAAMVAIIAGGRFLHALLIAPWLARRALRPRPEHAPRARLARWLVPFALGTRHSALSTQPFAQSTPYSALRTQHSALRVRVEDQERNYDLHAAP